MSNKTELKNLNITHILTVANFVPPFDSSELVCNVVNGKTIAFDFGAKTMPTYEEPSSCFCVLPLL